MAVRRISSTSRMAASSSTTRTLRVISTGGLEMAPSPPALGRPPASPWRASGLLSLVSSLLPLQVQVDFLELLEIGTQPLRLLPQPGQLAVARGQLAAQPGQLAVARAQLAAQPRQLDAGGDDGGDGVAALLRARRGRVGRIAREELVVRAEGRLVLLAIGQTIGACQQGRRAVERPVRAGAAADHDGQRRHHHEEAHAATRGSSTLNRLPLPSWDSTVTRPWWACTMPRTTARPRPVPPRSRCAWRQDSKMCGSAAAGMPTP